MNSTQQLVETVMTRLLDFVPSSGTTLRTRLGGGASARLYTVQAPNDPVYPYAVLRIATRPQTLGYAGYRSEAGIEVQVFDRPRSQQWVAEGIADLIEQATLGWCDPTGTGLVFARHLRRMTLPPAPSPMDREVVVVTLSLPVAVWPAYLITA